MTHTSGPSKPETINLALGLCLPLRNDLYCVGQGREEVVKLYPLLTLKISAGLAV